MKNYIKIHPSDKVAVALQPLSAGSVISIDDTLITLAEDIPQGHKFALTALAADEPVIPKMKLPHSTKPMDTRTAEILLQQ